MKLLNRCRLIHSGTVVLHTAKDCEEKVWWCQLFCRPEATASTILDDFFPIRGADL